MLAGAAITAVARSGHPATHHFTPQGVAVAIAFGVLSAAALGIDFPESNRRFARLA